ncbi:MAG: hypothetical protein JWR37_1267 [Mycobacterium sp.]|nr:hypothetical protein [Mycobacterium sp.]
MIDPLAFGTTLACLVTAIALVVTVVTGRYRLRGFAPMFALIQLMLVVQAVLAVVGLVDGHRTPELTTHLAYLVTSQGVLPVAVATTSRQEDRWSAGVLAVALLALAVVVVRLITTWRTA